VIRRVHRISDEEPKAPRHLAVVTSPPPAAPEQSDHIVELIEKAFPKKQKESTRKRRIWADQQWVDLLSPLFDQGLTQAEVSEKVHISRSRISEIVRRLKIGTRTYSQRRPNTCPHCGGRIAIHTMISKGEAK
jgi:hypothetical protein